MTDTDRALQAYALRLIELRKLMDAELESHLAQLEQSTARYFGLTTCEGPRAARPPLPAGAAHPHLDHVASPP